MNKNENEFPKIENVVNIMKILQHNFPNQQNLLG